MATQKERSSSNDSPGTTPTPPPASGLQTEEGTAKRPRATSTETPANQDAAFDPDMMEKFFSFMSFYEQHQQGAPAQSNNSNNNNTTPMSLDGRTNKSISNNSTLGSSRTNTSSSIDNIGSNRDNIGSSRNNGSSSSNIDTNRWSFNCIGSNRRHSTDSCAAAEPNTTRSTSKRKLHRKLLLQLRLVPSLTWTSSWRRHLARTNGTSKQHGYRPPSARAGRFSQRAQWGLHLGIERNYNAWKIFDVHSKATVAARDVIFYERLTLPTYLANLEEDRDPTGGFRGNRCFASVADEADWDEQNVDEVSEEVRPLPYCSVNVPMDDENPRESANADVFYHFADNNYVTPAEVNTNEAERIGPNFIPDPEAGDEAAYPADTTLPCYTQSGLQILGLVTAVHGTEIPKEPATVQQALGGEHREKWREAMDKELKALDERNTWKVVPIGVARNKTVLTGKWVFRVKTKADGTIDKFKARWVVRGFDQEHGCDFTETFAPVSRHTSLRILLAIAAMKKKKLRQIDVANAFLYAPVDAEIFVELPHGSHGEPNQVCQLQKSLYGIKQAPRLWQQYLHARLIRIGFRQLPHDQGMYRLTKGTDYILLIVYVDDLLYIGSTNNVTTWFEGELQKDLTLTVSSAVTQYLDLNIQEEEDAIYLNAAKYADTIAKRFVKHCMLCLFRLHSSCEAEIYATAMAAQELRWLTYLLTDLGEQPRSPPVLYVDNKATIALCGEHRLEHRTKHIALRYFLARELQQRGQLCLRYVATRANNADVFTKALQPCDHQRFCTVLGLVPTVPHLLTS
ncbi:unnamed protein product [Closterium sp. NIES-53]